MSELDPSLNPVFRSEADPAIADGVDAAEATSAEEAPAPEEEATAEAEAEPATPDDAPETPAEPEATAAEPADTETTEPAPATTPEEEAPADDETGEDAPDETPEARAARLEAENVALRERETQHLRKIGELEGQVGELQGQIAALTTRVSELEARLGVRPAPAPPEAGTRPGEVLPHTDLAESMRVKSWAAIDAICQELLDSGTEQPAVDKARLDMRNFVHQNMIDVNREHGKAVRDRAAADLENAELRRRLAERGTTPTPGEAVDPAIADGVRAAEAGADDDTVVMPTVPPRPARPAPATPTPGEAVDPAIADGVAATEGDTPEPATPVDPMMPVFRSEADYVAPTGEAVDPAIADGVAAAGGEAAPRVAEEGRRRRSFGRVILDRFNGGRGNQPPEQPES